MDETFYHTLRVGMPPAGGVGFGIDRLLIILTDSSDIIEVIPFSTYHESQKSN
ncbi:MAG: amino acid--tRNA ligase-related protein [Candidatus Saccharibacteria bacterium]